MLNYADPVDGVFHALGDPTRRAIVDRLSHGPATVSELAAPLPISLPAVVQHLAVLQECGLVDSQKVGRVRTCQVRPATMRQAERWIAQRRDEWERRLDRLGEFLVEQDNEKG
jgi:DNA-binding transcriptional ArsR family regulator